MRLTNVAHLRLPFGRLMGYDVEVSPPLGSLPVSFDQRRHVAAGDRAGSWMALAFRLDTSVGREDLAAAWLEVIRRHGTLRTVFEAGDDGGPRLHEVEVRPGAWTEHPVAPGQAVNEALCEVLDASCSPYRRPAHRLCVLETAAGPTVIIAADHSHVDMWSMLVIARDVLAALAAGGGEGATPPEIALPFADHTRAMLERPRAPEDVRSRWAEILAAGGEVMPRFPLPLGAIELKPERVEMRDVFDVDDSAAFTKQAREEGVSTLALAVSAMTTVTRDLADSPLRAVFPVHSRYEPAWHDSVGWFITNSVLESADPDPRSCSSAVRESIRLGSWPLEDLLRPWGGMPEAPGMFAISWLDLRRLPVRIDAAGLEAQYVGASVRTDGVMLWFVLDESGLHLRCRYPDTPEGRRHVGSWLDALVQRLQAVARSSAGGLLRTGQGTFRIERARRSDVPEILAVVSADAPDEPGDRGEITRRAESAYDGIARDRSHYLAVVRDGSEQVVATMQLTVVTGLARGGTAHLQIDGFRVAPGPGAEELGTAMVDWAHEHGRARGAVRATLVPGTMGPGSGAVFERLGYRPGGELLEREL